VLVSIVWYSASTSAMAPCKEMLTAVGFFHFFLTPFIFSSIVTPSALYFPRKEACHAVFLSSSQL
jgi:hypothetical protein